MKIKNVYIKNFRGIGELDSPIELLDFNIFIGDNSTGKTAILEAINYCLSPGYIASRLDINDFHNGSQDDIEITVEFDSNFTAKLADGFTTQSVECNKITLLAKKRERSAPGKAFSDLVTTTHYVVPVSAKGTEGWSQSRKGGSDFKFTERQLALSNVDVEIPRAFYFSKTRNRQLTTGYNSSLTNIVNDLNWRFDKSQRDKEDADHFKHERKKLHEKVMSETGGDTLKKTIDSANEILEKLEIDKIDISLLKTLTPYDHTEIVFPFDGFELPVEHSGSGIEMTIAIALLEAMAKISKEKILLIIDEPELHLHPKLQGKLFEHLKEIAGEIQIVASTHSPILFKNVYQNPDIKLLISKKEDNKISIHDARASGFGLLKWSPSWGEICYFAYGHSTTEFLDDLYSTIEDNLKTSPTQKISQEDTENWLVSKGQTKEIKWTATGGSSQEETLMTYVRNRIHHSDNQSRPIYTPEQLQESIERMVTLLKNP
ncbi:MAG: AAA family ATPase [bacterium]|nr:AAA family ATPase [bacterium]